MLLGIFFIRWHQNEGILCAQTSYPVIGPYLIVNFISWDKISSVKKIDQTSPLAVLLNATGSCLRVTQQVARKELQRPVKCEARKESECFTLTMNVKWTLMISCSGARNCNSGKEGSGKVASGWDSPWFRWVKFQEKTRSVKVSRGQEVLGGSAEVWLIEVLW